MRAGEDHRVEVEQSTALLVQVLVGGEVVSRPPLFEPVDQVEIRTEAVWDARNGHRKAGPHCDLGAQQRDGVVSGTQPDRVEAAAQARGNLQGEGGLPAGVLEIVLVEVNSRVLVWCGREVDLPAAPAPTCDCAARLVDELAVVTPGNV